MSGAKSSNQTRSIWTKEKYKKVHNTNFKKKKVKQITRLKSLDLKPGNRNKDIRRKSTLDMVPMTYDVEDVCKF